MNKRINIRNLVGAMAVATCLYITAVGTASATVIVHDESGKQAGQSNASDNGSGHSQSWSSDHGRPDSPGKSGSAGSNGEQGNSGGDGRDGNQEHGDHGQDDWTDLGNPGPVTGHGDDANGPVLEYGPEVPGGCGGDCTSQSVPEPGSLALLGLGLAGLGLTRRRR